MSRAIETSFVDALGDSVVYPFFAVELLFDSPNELRFWTGLGDLDYDGKVWTGAGNLLSISDVEETNEIAAKGATLTLNGIQSNAISLALQEPYQGRRCNIYLGLQNNGSLVLTEVFAGYMDQMNIEEGPNSASITLRVENKLVELERPRVRRYTSGFQKSVYPNDKGLDFVEDLQDKEVFWGRKADSGSGGGSNSTQQPRENFSNRGP